MCLLFSYFVVLLWEIHLSREGGLMVILTGSTLLSDFVCLKAGPNLLLTNDVITYVSNDVNMSLFVVLLILVELLTFTV